MAANRAPLVMDKDFHFWSVSDETETSYRVNAGRYVRKAEVVLVSPADRELALQVIANHRAAKDALRKEIDEKLRLLRADIVVGSTGPAAEYSIKE